MDPKLIHDVAPSANAQPAAPAEPPSGPELVSQIPVRAPAGQAASPAEESSFIINNSPQPPAGKKDKKIKQGGPKPVAAIVVACLALVFLAAGSYFEFLANH